MHTQPSLAVMCDGEPPTPKVRVYDQDDSARVAVTVADGFAFYGKTHGAVLTAIDAIRDAVLASAREIGEAKVSADEVPTALVAALTNGAAAGNPLAAADEVWSDEDDEPVPYAVATCFAVFAAAELRCTRPHGHHGPHRADGHRWNSGTAVAL